MATSDTNFCTLCHDGGTSNEAVSWCTDCEVFLCKDCEKHHSKTRMFHNHKTMSTNDYNNLPAFIQKISGQCKDHKKNFDLYCPSHACPCCVQCITDKHNKCQDMQLLANILKQIKSSASVQLLERDLVDLKGNFLEMIKYLKRMIITNNIQKAKAIEEIQSMKKSVNDILSTLEKEILADLESKHSKLKSEINTLLEQMEQQAIQTEQMLSEFSKMTEHATELQMYIGLREIEKKTTQAAKYKDGLESGDHFNEMILEVSISPVLQSVLQDVKSFGDVNIRTGPSTLLIKSGRKDQAQNLVPNVPGIDQIKPSFLTKLNITHEMSPLTIQTCRILPSGRFLLILNFYGKRVILFNHEGILMREVTKPEGNAQDICSVRNDTVAVSLGVKKKTALVDVEKNKIIKILKFFQRCDSVASDGQILVISSKNKSTIVNLNDESRTILEGVTATSISLFKGNIYGISNDGKVCCYNCSGELIRIFKHKDINNPCGLGLDKNGFIYLASLADSSIVVVSPDCKISKKILSEADEINEPVSIDINRETGMMIVSSKIKDASDDKFYETAFVYKI